MATNIAETSITIDDAVFVIDSGRAKQMLFDERKQMRRLVHRDHTSHSISATFTYDGGHFL